MKTTVRYWKLVAADENRTVDAYTLYLQEERPGLCATVKTLRWLSIISFGLTEVDPSYAEAYAGLADCYVSMTTVAYGALASKDSDDQGRMGRRQAMKFGDNLAESHSASRNRFAERSLGLGERGKGIQASHSAQP